MKTIEKPTTPDEFASTLRQLAGVVRDIIQIEESKASAASQRQHGMIDDLLKEEQVYILKLRGLEQKRLKQTDALGFKGLTFRQVLEQADGAQRELLSPLFAELSEQTKLLTEAKDSSERIIKLRLREFEETLAKSGRTNGQGAAGLSHFQDKYV